MDPAVGEMIYECVNGKIYYISAVSGKQNECVAPGGGTPYCTNRKLAGAPGVTSLDGNNWGGVTKGDVIGG